ncbi:hypothetical protein V6N13_014968 [Hibiscus sabdariffa]
MEVGRKEAHGITRAERHVQMVSPLFLIGEIGHIATPCAQGVTTVIQAGKVQHLAREPPRRHDDSEAGARRHL